MTHLQLVIDNDQPIPPVDLYAHWQDEPHWHESQQAEAHGWATIAAFGFACFGAGCLVTTAAAWVISWFI
jgi:hypothetical protein